MSRIVSVINSKGGVGKTAVTANLGAELANRGYRVLLLDLDPQASLTFSFFRPPEWMRDLAAKRTIRQWYEEFYAGQGDTELWELIVTPPEVNARLAHPEGRLDLIASHLGLTNVDLQLANQLFGGDPAGAEARFLEVHGWLADGLAAAEFTAYDLILIDCPSNFNIVTKTAVVASPHILVPSRADDLSTLSISHLDDNVTGLVKDYNERVRAAHHQGKRSTEIAPAFLGIVFTMVKVHDGRPTKVHQNVIRDTTTAHQQIPVFETTVRDNQRLHTEATGSAVPLAVAARVDDVITREFARLADEFLLRLGMKGNPR